MIWKITLANQGGNGKLSTLREEINSQKLCFQKLYKFSSTMILWLQSWKQDKTTRSKSGKNLFKFNIINYFTGKKYLYSGQMIFNFNRVNSIRIDFCISCKCDLLGINQFNLLIFTVYQKTLFNIYYFSIFIVFTDVNYFFISFY